MSSPKYPIQNKQKFFTINTYKAILQAFFESTTSTGVATVYQLEKFDFGNLLKPLHHHNLFLNKYYTNHR
jgi:hypothetical protein